MRRTSTLIVVLGLTLALGCKKEKPTEKAPAKPTTEKAATPKSTATDKPAPTAEDKPKAPPKVTLLEPGAEPRRELRYTPAKGLKQTLVTTIGLEVQTKLKGTPGPAQKMPPMIMTMTAEVTDAAPEKFSYTFEVTKAEVGAAEGVPKMIADSVGKELAKISGLKGKAVVDARGFTTEASLDVPKGVPPRMRELMKNMQQSIDQLAAPLPVEAVGKGAKWKVEQTITQSGMTLQQTSFFELVSLDEGSAEVSVIVEQNADAQPLNAPGVPTGAKLNKMIGKGKGRSKLVFGKIAPEESEVEVTTDTSITVLVGSAEQTMETQTKMSMKLTGK